MKWSTRVLLLGSHFGCIKRLFVLHNPIKNHPPSQNIPKDFINDLIIRHRGVSDDAHKDVIWKERNCVISRSCN